MSIKLKNHILFFTTLIVILVISPIISFINGWNQSIIEDPSITLKGLILQCCVVLVVFLIIFFWEYKPLKSIGTKTISKYDVVWIFWITVFALGSFTISYNTYSINHAKYLKYR